MTRRNATDTPRAYHGIARSAPPLGGGQSADCGLRSGDLRDPLKYSQDLKDLDEHFVLAEDAFEGSGEALEPVVAHERQLAIPEVALAVRATAHARALALALGRPFKWSFRSGRRGPRTGRSSEPISE